MMPSIRQKNDLTDEVQLVCHGLDPGVQAAHERTWAVKSVRGVTRAAMDCRWGGARMAAVLPPSHALRATFLRVEATRTM
jgi:hypothetical protein